MHIRTEKPADYSLIHHVTELAFKPMRFSDGTEADIIDQLRADGDLSLSLVAEVNNELTGHVAFSKVVIGDIATGWYGLGPVAVHPDVQRQGIGSALIEQGLTLLKKDGAAGCALLGDPKYYSRFGFVSDGKVSYKDLPAAHIQWLSFGEIQPVGELVYCRAFDG